MTRLDITAILISVLTTATAVVMLAKAIVELKSAKIKHPRDAATPHDNTATSNLSQMIDRRFGPPSWFPGALLVVGNGVFIWLLFGPSAHSQPTVRDVALVGISITNIIHAYRWLK